ncbi:protein no-on-transient A-like isoform X3 [Poecile atricapillus]|uniref:protein no-on-transient A-like isoform X3 n=1 Tax=Poecile atricapillus TaxID=48891 RepID=UPI0027391B96|nr:protein no-on-transient A-like isoform X3 [Poecile atricapillus]
MAKASISLRSLNETLNRVESRLLSLEARFAQLDSSLQSLEHEFELQAEMLEEDLRRDVPWAPAARLGGGDRKGEGGDGGRGGEGGRTRREGGEKGRGGGGALSRTAGTAPQ